jgi:hypothetical protein
VQLRGLTEGFLFLLSRGLVPISSPDVAKLAGETHDFDYARLVDGDSVITLFQFAPPLLRRNPPFRDPASMIARIDQATKPGLVQIKGHPWIKPPYVTHHEGRRAIEVIARVMVADNTQSHLFSQN